MAVEAERLLINIEASVSRLEREMKRGRTTADRELAGIERRASAMAKNVNAQFATLARGIAAPLAGLAGVLGAGALVKLTDTWTDLNSRVAQATGSTEAGTEAMGRLTEMARRTYSSIEQTTESWLRQRLALDELGYSIDQQLDLVETLNNSMVISATRGQQAESVQKAFSDALATGALRTDGLNTILANSPRLAQALADSLGVTISQLRQMATAGTLTASKLGGITSQLEKVRKEADAMPATISDGLQLIQNALLEYVGRGDQAVGISGKLAEGLIILADNFDEVADTALQFATVLASALAGRGIALAIGGLGTAAKAVGAFIIAVRAGTAANIAFNATLGPLGLLAGVVAGAIFLVATRGDEAAKSMSTLQANTDRLREVSEELKTASGDVKSALEDEKAALEASSKAIRDNTLEKIKNAEASLAQLKAAQANDGTISRNVLDGAQMRLYEAEQTGEAAIIGRAKAEYDQIAAQYAQNPMVNETRGAAITALEETLDRLRKTLDEQTKVIKGEMGPNRPASAAPTPSVADTATSKVTSQQIYNTLEKFVGLNEKRDKNELAAYFKQQGLGNIDPTKTAWCMAIINAVLNENKLPGSGSLMARSALGLGTATDNPVQGDLVVMKRGNNGVSGHVGLFSGYDQNGNVRVLGGNQSDGVNVQSYNRDSVLGFRRVAGVDPSAQSSNIQAVIKLREDEAEAAKKAADEHVASYQKIIGSGAEYIVQLQLEAEQRGMTAEAAAALRYEQDMLNQAQQAGIDLSDAQREQLRMLAEGMASAEVASQNLAEAQAQLSDLAEGAFKGFAQDLLAGKSAAEAFEGVLGRIADKLLDMALDGLFQNLFSSGGKGGGGLFGFLGNIFGGGRAKGGSISSRKAYVVGEKGPELFAPGRSGTVIPTHNMPSLAAPRVPAGGQAQPIRLNVVNNTGVQADARTERQPDGSMSVILDKAVAQKLATRGTETNDALRQNYGARQRLASR